jgi:hypothetical protein
MHSPRPAITKGARHKYRKLYAYLQRCSVETAALYDNEMLLYTRDDRYDFLKTGKFRDVRNSGITVCRHMEISQDFTVTLSFLILQYRHLRSTTGISDTIGYLQSDKWQNTSTHTRKFGRQMRLNVPFQYYSTQRFGTVQNYINP